MSDVDDTGANTGIRYRGEAGSIRYQNVRFILGPGVNLQESIDLILMRDPGERRPAIEHERHLGLYRELETTSRSLDVVRRLSHCDQCFNLRRLQRNWEAFIAGLKRRSPGVWVTIKSPLLRCWLLRGQTRENIRLRGAYGYQLSLLR